jgi:arylsulfatase A-like enzyme
MKGGHRVPFFIHWPAGKIEKDRSGELCGHVDLIPTLLELCQIDFPSGNKERWNISCRITGEKGVHSS